MAQEDRPPRAANDDEAGRGPGSSADSDDNLPELDISADKVAFIIMKAREFETKVAPFDEGDMETSDEQDMQDGVLENRKDDPDVKEISAFIRALNEDEKANLVAIAWVGRETYGPEDWDTALATAREERSTPTELYLLGMPLLSEYLEEGMAALGFEMAEVEADLLAEG